MTPYLKVIAIVLMEPLQTFNQEEINGQPLSQ